MAQGQANLQWSALEKADPTDPQLLVSHLKHLIEATQKCEKRLKEELEKRKQGMGLEKPVSSTGAASSGSAASTGLEKPGSRKRSVSLTMAHRWKDGNPRKASLTPAQPLEKPATKEDASAGLEKLANKEEPAGLEKPEKARPVVVVDWHQTLEFGDNIHPQDLQALEMLCSKCKVVIISYVASEWRGQKVMKDIQEMAPFHSELFGKKVCWVQTGELGKAHKAWDLKAVALFDEEALQWDIVPYPIYSPKENHSWLARGYETFAEAVNKFLFLVDNPKL